MNTKINKVYFDENHLRQILINLVSNSLESTSGEGKIMLAASANSSHWEIKVSDNGSGISEDDMSLIFNPFFTTKKNGTGLGLSIIKKLCKENKAEISVINNSDKGSTFTIKKEIINES
jgi:signal transduction histidine kinase